MSEVVFQQLLQLLLLMGVGYGLGKLNLIEEACSLMLSKLILQVTMPALILTSVLSNMDTGTLALQDICVAGGLLVIALPLIALLCSRYLPKQTRALYAFMIMYPNVGFIGFPLLLALYGSSAMLYTAIINMAFNISLFSLGVWIMDEQSRKRCSHKQLCSPGILASLLALLFYFMRLQLPTVILQPLELLGTMTTPLAMLMIGATLSAYPLHEVLLDKKLSLFTLLHNLALPLMFYPIITLWIQDAMLQGITLIILSMPVANGAALFARQYHHDEALASKAIFLSTLFSVVTIPWLVTLLS